MTAGPLDHAIDALTAHRVRVLRERNEIGRAPDPHDRDLDASTPHDPFDVLGGSA